MNAVFSMHQVNPSSAFEPSNIIFFFFNTFMSDDVDPDDDGDDHDEHDEVDVEDREGPGGKAANQLSTGRG